MRIVVLLLFVLSFGLIKAQELDFSVSLQVPNNTNTDPSVFKSLEKDITEFINNNKWTEDEFQPSEKIKGKLQITITSAKDLSFVADVSVQISRPVFNADYISPLLNYYDKGITFNYIQGQNLIKSDKTYLDNLSSTLTFYAYLALGFDYDSFELYGGEKYFSAARETYNNLPNGIKTSDEAWANKGINGRNKYWLIENILSPRLREFRQMFYEYHRSSLDNMYQDVDKNRAVMLSALSNIEGLHQSYPNSYLLQIFSDTKFQEIIEIFKPGDSGQRNKVRNLLTLTNQAKKDRFDELK